MDQYLIFAEQSKYEAIIHEKAYEFDIKHEGRDHPKGSRLKPSSELYLAAVAYGSQLHYLNLVLEYIKEGEKSADLPEIQSEIETCRRQISRLEEKIKDSR